MDETKEYFGLLVGRHVSVVVVVATSCVATHEKTESWEVFVLQIIGKSAFTLFHISQKPP